jgi:serine/threonine-protein kinase RsbW
MIDKRRIELRLESTIDSVDAAELIVQGLAREAGFGSDEVDHLGMAVRECVANAVTHGNAYSREKHVHFRVEVGPEGLRVTIRDEGEGFDPSSVPDPTAPENLFKASGRGLLLMNALVDEFRVGPGAGGGAEVALLKRLPGRDAAE